LLCYTYLFPINLMIYNLIYLQLIHCCYIARFVGDYLEYFERFHLDIRKIRALLHCI